MNIEERQSEIKGEDLTVPPLAIMLTHKVLVGREECSRQERISVL